MTGAPPKNAEKRSVSSVAELTIDPQVRPLREDALQPAEEEVDRQAPLVRLVEDDRVVAAEERVALDLGEEDAVGHELHVRARRRAVLEADLVADLGARAALPSSLATRAATLVAAMRRGWVTPIFASSAAAHREAILGSCVVLPEPVAPATITTGCSSIAGAMSRTRAEIGSSGGKRMGELASWGGGSPAMPRVP